MSARRGTAVIARAVERVARAGTAHCARARSTRFFDSRVVDRGDGRGARDRVTDERE